MKRIASCLLMSLFVFGILAGSMALPSQARAQSKECWCCFQGRLAQMSPDECKKRRGRCYPTKQQAREACGPEECWCCYDGTVNELPPQKCEKRRGRCYPTKPQALKRCAERECWCCIDGQVMQMSSKLCKRKQGECFRSRAEAKKGCLTGGEVCCLAGKYDGKSVDDPEYAHGETSAFLLILRQPNCGKKFHGEILDPSSGVTRMTIRGTITPAGGGCCNLVGVSTAAPGTDDEGCRHRIKARLCRRGGTWFTESGSYSIMTGDCLSGTFSMRQR